MTASLGASSRLPHREPRLVVPEGMLIDELVRPRLARQLDCAPAHVSGVVAETQGLAPGASYRVHAEWKALEPLATTFHARARVARGAVLLRSGVSYRVHDGTVQIDDGVLLLDPGAAAHDPWQHPGPVLPATAAGRSPFPWRPVVLFVACEDEPAQAEWVRNLINALIRRDVEARLAVPNITTGLHLTRPCEPSAQSVQALKPDVVVAMDAPAAEAVADWCGSLRAPVVVEFRADTDKPIELVPWQIGRASGRLRARVGARITASSMVSLVHRLCAGPQPVPPADRVHTDAAATRRRDAAEQTCVVLAGETDHRVAARAAAIADHLAAAGVATEIKAPRRGRTPRHAYDADLVLLLGSHEPGRLADLLRSRRSASRPTVVDIGPADLREATSGMQSVVLNADAAQLARACGLASTASEAVHAGIRTMGARVQLLPSLLTRVQIAALHDAGVGRATSPDPVVGWHLEGSGMTRPSYVGAVAEGLAKLLGDRADARLEIVSNGRHIPKPLQGIDRVTAIEPDPPPAVIAGWAVHVAAPALLDGLLVDDLRGIAEAGTAGVPTVLPAGPQGLEGVVSSDLAVVHLKEPEEWAAPVRRLLADEGLRSRRAAEAARRARTVNGPAAAAAAVRRFVGWAHFRPVP